MPSATASSALPAVPATAADSLVNSIGTDTHFNYQDSGYATNFTQIAAALIASGIRHVRDGEPGDNRAAALAYLATHGIKHSAIFPVTTTAAQITSTLQGYAPNVEFVEPQNEYDEYAQSDPNWAAHIVAELKLLDATVRSNPAFASVKVLGPALAVPGDYKTVGPLDAYEDAGNEHNYPCNYNPDNSIWIDLNGITSFVRDSTLYKPIWTTEVGYADNPDDWSCALSDSVIAKYDPRTVAERWNAGMPFTYFYQFADLPTDISYESMGLVQQNGTPKPQYTALQSMIALLGDPGFTFTPSALNYQLSGSTSNVHQLLLQKHDGSYYLLLWLEVPSWNTTSNVPLSVPPQSVALNLARTPSAATQYTYTGAWALQAAGLTPSTHVSLSVTDSITFVHLTF